MADGNADDDRHVNTDKHRNQDADTHADADAADVYADSHRDADADVEPGADVDDDAGGDVHAVRSVRGYFDEHDVGADVAIELRIVSGDRERNDSGRGYAYN